MSDSSKGDDIKRFCDNSDGDGSATSVSASFLASYQQGRQKRPRVTQSLGKAWILRGEIKTNMLPNDSDDAKFQKCNPSYRLHSVQDLKICLETCAAPSRIMRFSATLATL
jgi:hypothetical protein